MTDAAGNVVHSYQYDAWGNIEAETGAPVDGVQYAFTGREWDPETGLYYYRARYLDPKVGRFISEDPIGLADGLNLYTYVHGNPVTRIDPTGMVDSWDAFFNAFTRFFDALASSGEGGLNPVDPTKDAIDAVTPAAKSYRPQPTSSTKMRSQTMGGRGACRVPRGGPGKLIGRAGSIYLDPIALAQGIEADADRGLRAMEAGISYEQQLVIDAGENDGMILTPFGVYPVEVLVGRQTY
jgi:RHS repeat-associated protein